MKEANSIELWVVEHTDYLLRLAIFKTGNAKLSEDLVQDTFMSAFESINTFKGESSSKTWLVTILKNKIVDYHRKESRKGQIFSIESENQSAHEDFDDFDNWRKSKQPNSWDIDSENLFDDKDFQQVLENCMSNLPPRDEAVLRLKFLESIDSDKICQDLDISASNYWQLLHRAKLKLRKCMELKWFNRD